MQNSPVIDAVLTVSMHSSQSSFRNPFPRRKVSFLVSIRVVASGQPIFVSDKPVSSTYRNLNPPAELATKRLGSGNENIEDASEKEVLLLLMIHLLVHDHNAVLVLTAGGKADRVQSGVAVAAQLRSKEALDLNIHKGLNESIKLVVHRRDAGPALGAVDGVDVVVDPGKLAGASGAVSGLGKAHAGVATEVVPERHGDLLNVTDGPDGERGGLVVPGAKLGGDLAFAHDGGG